MLCVAEDELSWQDPGPQNEALECASRQCCLIDALTEE